MVASMALKAVCFDLDGTLYRLTPVRIEMACKLMLGILNGRTTIRKIRALQVYRRTLERLRNLGSIENLGARLLTEAASSAGCSVEEMSVLVQHWIYDAPLKLLSRHADPRLKHMVVRLGVRGYRLAILSDYPIADKLGALGIPQNRLGAVIEARDTEVNALKPDPIGYREIARRLSLSPSEIVYVGDRESVDGIGARAAGMEFILVGRSKLPQQKSVERILDLELKLPSCAVMQERRRERGCWICGSSASSVYSESSLGNLVRSDLVRITDSDFGRTAKLVRCDDCGFIHADLPEALAIQKQYREMEDEAYEDSHLGRQKSFEVLLEEIQKLRPEARTLLDIGAGTGILALAAKNRGFDVDGIEPSLWAVERACALRGMRIRQGYFPEGRLLQKRYDVITALDVIEHVSDPAAFLSACRDALEPGGMLVLVTPNIESLGARLIGHRWWHFRPAHIGYFGPSTMFAALGAAGFNVEKFESFRRWFEIRYIASRLRPRILSRMVDSILKVFPRISGAPVCFSMDDCQTYFAGLHKD